MRKNDHHFRKYYSSNFETLEMKGRVLFEYDILEDSIKLIYFCILFNVFMQYGNIWNIRQTEKSSLTEHVLIDVDVLYQIEHGLSQLEVENIIQILSENR